MEMVLTGRTIDAAEAERCGLVSRIVPASELLEEALKVAERIASMSRPSVLVAKESVNLAYDPTGRFYQLNFGPLLDISVGGHRNSRMIPRRDFGFCRWAGFGRHPETLGIGASV